MEDPLLRVSSYINADYPQVATFTHLYSILVVGGSKDLLHNQLSRPSDDDGLVSKVPVLEQNPAVLLVDTDGICDRLDPSVPGREVSVEVVDGTLAVTPEGQAVGHIPAAVLAEVEGMLALVWVLRIATGSGVSLTHLNECTREGA